MDALINLFYNTPNWLLFISMVTFGVLFTLVGIHVVKYILPIELRLRDNIAIGYISANTCVLFSILAGFIVLYMLNNYNKAQSIVSVEVSRASAIYKDAMRLDRNLALQVQSDVKKYLDTVISKEWVAMQRGEKGSFSLYGEAVLNQLRYKLNNYKPKDYNKVFAVDDIYRELEDLGDARDERLSLNKSALTVHMWIALLIGAVLTVIINFVYGMEHYFHLFLAPFVSTLVAILLFMILAMDQPFRGNFAIKPKEYQEVLSTIKSEYEVNGISSWL